MINKHPISNVAASDIGCRVTYQHAGMNAPRRGAVTALSDIKGMAWVTFDGNRLSNLTDIYNCRWGDVEGWVKSK